MTYNAGQLPPQLRLTQLDDVDVGIIKAFAEGRADKDQQRKAFQLIVQRFCGIDDQPFVPGEDGQRLTDFSLGKRQVGLDLIKVVNLPVEMTASGKRIEENL